MYARDNKKITSRTTNFFGYIASGGTAYPDSLVRNVTITAFPWSETKSQNIYTTNYPTITHFTDISNHIVSQNDIAWIELETYLNELDDFNIVDPEEDGIWLDNIRSGWSDRLDDLYES